MQEQSLVHLNRCNKMSAYEACIKMPASEACLESDDRWTISIKEIPEFDCRSPSDVWIFKVPNIFKQDMKIKKEAYVPKRVSLGPYHHGSAGLLSMESHKKRAMYRVMMRKLNNPRAIDEICCQRSSPFMQIMSMFKSNSINETNYKDFCHSVTEKIGKVERIKDSYEETILSDGKILSLMLSLDGCFILEILRTMSGEFEFDKSSKSYEPIFDKTRIVHSGVDILHDILKLENQIPFFVLRKLLKLELKLPGVEVRKKLSHVLCSSFLYFFYPFNKKDIVEQNVLRLVSHQGKVHHLLDLLHGLIVCPQSRDGECAPLQDEDTRLPESVGGYTSLPGQDESNAVNDEAEGDARNVCAWIRKIGKLWNQKTPERDIPNAELLQTAGIKFQSQDTGGIKSIGFDKEKAILYLPPITITESTEIIFRNLIAFEMCKFSENKFFAGYVRLMNKLIDKPEDVELLEHEGIVTHRLGSGQDVADLFNGLYKGVIASPEEVSNQGTRVLPPSTVFFKHIEDGVKNHYTNKRKSDFGKFAQKYLSTWWSRAVLLWAIASVVCTIIQTIYTVVSFLKTI